MWELEHESDLPLKNYLTFGVTEGFFIVDNDCVIPRYNHANYRSATTGPAFDFINKLIVTELSNDKYVSKIYLWF